MKMRNVFLTAALIGLMVGPASAATVYIDAFVNSGTWQDGDGDWWNIVGNASGQGLVDSENNALGSVTVTGCSNQSLHPHQLSKSATNRKRLRGVKT